MCGVSAPADTGMKITCTVLALLLGALLLVAQGTVSGLLRLRVHVPVFEFLAAQ